MEDMGTVGFAFWKEHSRRGLKVESVYIQQVIHNSDEGNRHKKY